MSIDQIEIDVLGPFRVRRNGVDETHLPAWRRSRVVDLLVVLVDERRIRRDRLADTLWPAKTHGAAMNNLRVNLCHLLAALEPGRAPGAASSFVRCRGSEVSLEPTVHVDVDRFEEHLAASRVVGLSAADAHAHLVAASTLYRGDYLDGREGSDQAFLRGMLLRDGLVDALVDAATSLLTAGCHRDAQRLAARACELEPLHEEAHQVLAESLLDTRRVGHASRLLERLLARLDDLALCPLPSTTALAARTGIIGLGPFSDTLRPVA